MDETINKPCRFLLDNESMYFKDMIKRHLVDLSLVHTHLGRIRQDTSTTGKLDKIIKRINSLMEQAKTVMPSVIEIHEAISSITSKIEVLLSELPDKHIEIIYNSHEESADYYVTNRITYFLYNTLYNTVNRIPNDGRISIQTTCYENYVKIDTFVKGCIVNPNIWDALFNFGYNSQKESGYGIRCAQQLVQIIGGYLNINHQETDGIAFTIELPVMHIASKPLPDPTTYDEVKYTDFSLRMAPDGHITAKFEDREVIDNTSIEFSEYVKRHLTNIHQNMTNEHVLRGVGTELYRIIFPNRIHNHLIAAEAVANSRNENIRIRLTIEPDELAGAPWELLYSEKDGYVSVHPKKTLSHYLYVDNSLCRKREGSLHLLLIIASPNDQRVKPDVDKWENLITETLSKPLKERKLTIRTVKKATFDNIQETLLNQKPDIIQFIGHGRYKNRKGYLALLDSNGNTWEVDESQFLNILRGFDDHLGLVCLASCETAASDSPQGFIGIAPKLVREGIPAVIAMRYLVLEDTLKIFLENFYQFIAARKPIDWAVQMARKAIGIKKGWDNREFATPVLFMRAKDGNIF